ncbi:MULTISPECIES: hypothetical protein [unclassified Clostridium]|nr:MULTISPECIES: hypothetical protein [unclassified Clostridium]
MIIKNRNLKNTLSSEGVRYGSNHETGNYEVGKNEEHFIHPI